MNKKSIKSHIDNALFADRKKQMVIAVFLVAFLSVFFFYADIKHNTRQGIIFWEALFSGDFFRFYSLVAEAAAADRCCNANYGIFAQFILAVWQFPTFIVEQLLHIDVSEYFIGRLYEKLQFVIVGVLIAKQIEYIMYDICKDSERVHLSKIIFLTNSMTFLELSIVGQIDGIGVLFTLIAIRFLFEGKHKKFFWMFIIAVQCKFFALLIIIPMILLKEKNVFKIFFTVTIPLIVSVLLQLPFNIIDPEGVSNRTFDALEVMTDLQIPIGGMGVPVSLLFFGAVCFYAYYQKIEDDNYERMALYLAIAAFVSVLLSMWSYPYWMIYASPLFAMLFSLEKEDKKRRLVMATIGGCGIMVAYLLEFHWIFEYGFMYGMLADKILDMHRFELIGLWHYYDVLEQPEYFHAWRLSIGVFALWFIGFLIKSFPKAESFDKSDIQETPEEKRDLWRMIWLRAGIFFCLNGFSIIWYGVMIIRNIVLKFVR